MKLQGSASDAHAGKILALDIEQELISVLSAQGEPLRTVPWSALIRWLDSAASERHGTQTRLHPRTSLALRVTYATEGGRSFEGMTSGIGGGGLFIETVAPLPTGTALTVGFALPDRPWVRLTASGKVAWIRRKPERHVLLPGMGIQFIEIAPSTLDRLIGFITMLRHTRH
ncbi:MAG: PilZ domain-containing protein [Nitrospirota bacterium]